ncbi:MAG: hypothetical protein Q7R73_01575 [bacterium]|nr:hypothetical protein [bacterium]
MRTLKTLATILTLLLLTTPVAFAIEYPTEAPKNFKSSPIIICERSTPSVVHYNTYGSEENNLVVMLVGKNSKDLILAIERTEKNLGDGRLFFVATRANWQRATEAEMMSVIDSSFSDEEKGYFLSCTLESIQKMLNEIMLNELGKQEEK